MTGASPRIPRRVVVVRSERLTPKMRRITFGGEGLAGFSLAPDAWGPYVKLLIPRRDGEPVPRTYSVRGFDPVRCELMVDILLHAPRGLASAWAETARPGDAIGLFGPGAVPVAEQQDWIVLAGDQTALPAIAFTLERLPAGARGEALIALDDAEERQPLQAPAGIAIRWLDARQPLDEAVAESAWPNGGAAVLWAGAEAALARKIRAFARKEKKLDQDRSPILNYWKRGRPEGAFGYVE